MIQGARFQFYFVLFAKYWYQDKIIADVQNKDYLSGTHLAVACKTATKKSIHLNTFFQAVASCRCEDEEVMDDVSSK